MEILNHKNKYINKTKRHAEELSRMSHTTSCCDGVYSDSEGPDSSLDGNQPAELKSQEYSNCDNVSKHERRDDSTPIIVQGRAPLCCLSSSSMPSCPPSMYVKHSRVDARIGLNDTDDVGTTSSKEVKSVVQNSGANYLNIEQFDNPLYRRYHTTHSEASASSFAVNSHVWSRNVGHNLKDASQSEANATKNKKQKSLVGMTFESAMGALSSVWCASNDTGSDDSKNNYDSAKNNKNVSDYETKGEFESGCGSFFNNYDAPDGNVKPDYANQDMALGLGSSGDSPNISVGTNKLVLLLQSSAPDDLVASRLEEYLLNAFIKHPILFSKVHSKGENKITNENISPSTLMHSSPFDVSSAPSKITPLNCQKDGSLPIQCVGIEESLRTIDHAYINSISTNVSSYSNDDGSYNSNIDTNKSNQMEEKNYSTKVLNAKSEHPDFASCSFTKSNDTNHYNLDSKPCGANDAYKFSGIRCIEICADMDKLMYVAEQIGLMKVTVRGTLAPFNYSRKETFKYSGDSDKFFSPSECVEILRALCFDIRFGIDAPFKSLQGLSVMEVCITGGVVRDSFPLHHRSVFNKLKNESTLKSILSKDMEQSWAAYFGSIIPGFLGISGYVSKLMMWSTILYFLTFICVFMDRFSPFSILNLFENVFGVSIQENFVLVLSGLFISLYWGISFAGNWKQKLRISEYRWGGYPLNKSLVAKSTSCYAATTQGLPSLPLSSSKSPSKTISSAAESCFWPNALVVSHVHRLLRHTADPDEEVLFKYHSSFRKAFENERNSCFSSSSSSITSKNSKLSFSLSNIISGTASNLLKYIKESYDELRMSLSALMSCAFVAIMCLIFSHFFLCISIAGASSFSSSLSWFRIMESSFAIIVSVFSWRFTNDITEPYIRSVAYNFATAKCHCTSDKFIRSQVLWYSCISAVSPAYFFGYLILECIRSSRVVFHILPIICAFYLYEMAVDGTSCLIPFLKRRFGKVHPKIISRCSLFSHKIGSTFVPLFIDRASHEVLFPHLNLSKFYLRLLIKICLFVAFTPIFPISSFAAVGSVVCFMRNFTTKALSQSRREFVVDEMEGSWGVWSGIYEFSIAVCSLISIFLAFSSLGMNFNSSLILGYAYLALAILRRFSQSGMPDLVLREVELAERECEVLSMGFNLFPSTIFASSSSAAMSSSQSVSPRMQAASSLHGSIVSSSCSVSQRDDMSVINSAALPLTACNLGVTSAATGRSKFSKTINEGLNKINKNDEINFNQESSVASGNLAFEEKLNFKRINGVLHHLDIEKIFCDWFDWTETFDEHKEEVWGAFGPKVNISQMDRATDAFLESLNRKTTSFTSELDGEDAGGQDMSKTDTKSSDGPDVRYVHRCCGEWEFIRERSDILEPFSKHLGVPWMVRRAVENFDPVLEYGLNGNELSICTRLTVGITKTIRLDISGQDSSQGDEDVGCWQSTTRLDNTILRTVQRNRDLKATIYETRQVINEKKYIDGCPDMSEDVLWYKVILEKEGLDDEVVVNRFFKRLSGPPKHLDLPPELIAKKSEEDSSTMEQKSAEEKDELEKGHTIQAADNADLQVNPQFVSCLNCAGAVSDTIEKWVSDFSDWKVVQNGETTVYRKDVEGVPMMGAGQICISDRFTVDDVLEYLWDDRSKYEYDSQLLKGFKVVTYSDNCTVLYQAFKGQWGFAGRDLVLYCVKKKSEDGRSARVACVSAPEGVYVHDNMNDGLVRANASVAGYDMTLNDENKVVLTYVFQADLKTDAIPTWITDRVKLEQLNVVKSIKKALEKKK